MLGGNLVIWMRVRGSQLEEGVVEGVVVMKEKPLMVMVEPLVVRTGLEWVGKLMMVIGGAPEDA